MIQGDNEHLVFEKYAKENNLDREMHPLHLLYLNRETAEALEAFKAGYAAAQQQISEKEARIARLEQAIQIVLYAKDDISPLAAESLQTKLNESPQQSLAAIQADAIGKAIDQCAWDGDRVWIKINDLKEYAKQLRDKGKDNV